MSKKQLTREYYVRLSSHLNQAVHVEWFPNGTYGVWWDTLNGQMPVSRTVHGALAMALGVYGPPDAFAGLHDEDREAT